METYYMDSGTPLPRYYPLPQFLLDLKISSTSKILYAVLLNRANHLYIKISKGAETVTKESIC